MSLLDRVTAGSLDRDYAFVAARRGAGGEPGEPPRPPRRHLASMLVLLGFGVLLATAGVQTARTAPQRESSQEALVAQVQDRRAELRAARARLGEVRDQVEEAQAAALETSGFGRELQDRLTRLGASGGTVPVRGDGVRVTVDDAPGGASGPQAVLDTDVQILVNGLWLAGAEAIDINGQRLTNLSSIRVAGEAITVNLRSLSRPYVITAVGNADELAARFVETDGGQWWLNLQAVYGLQFTLTTEESLTVPATPLPTLRHARPAGPAS